MSEPLRYSVRVEPLPGRTIEEVVNRLESLGATEINPMAGVYVSALISGIDEAKLEDLAIVTRKVRQRLRTDTQMPQSLDFDAIRKRKPDASTTDVIAEAMLRSSHPEATDEQIEEALAVLTEFILDDTPRKQVREKALEKAAQLQQIFGTGASN